MGYFLEKFSFLSSRCIRDLEKSLSSLTMMAILDIPKKWRKKVFVALKDLVFIGNDALICRFSCYFI